jgi:hypothetical protein
MAKIKVKKTIKYPTYSIRLLPQTWEKLRREKRKSGRSWNMFILREILKYKLTKQRNK